MITFSFKLQSMFAALPMSPCGFLEAQMDSVAGLYENKPSVAAVFPLLALTLT
jgi:hypothetical protein